MQTPNLLKTIDQYTDEELIEYIRKIRHNREVARPVAKKKAEVAEKKSSRKVASAMDKLLAGLSDEEKLKILQFLEGNSDDN